ncbi:MAG: sigma-54 dependent transcriptional regulator [Planctomycetota bacterium]
MTSVTPDKNNTPAMRALVVDDHASARQSVADVLSLAGYQVAACASAVEALNRLAEQPVDVVVTDLQMPGMNGLEFIAEIGRRHAETQVLMITAHASVATAVEAMRLGAFDYLEKPFDATQLERSVSQACQRGHLLKQEGGTNTASAMIGDSPAMRRLREQIARVAATDETVLICGESGVGKELIAREIHQQSRRRSGPLVSLNCPVLSEQLTESELFGHKRGAFTGADADRVGRFEQARGGTILLDEITEVGLQLQAKLLRVLQEHTFERVGDSESTTLDARVLAATNRDLRAEVADGRFREDLYFRLAVLPLAAPPLRERGGDVIQLAEHFLQGAAARIGRRCGLSDTACELLLAHRWPGNVRELQNTITRACVLAPDDQIDADLIRPWLDAGETPADLTAAAPVGVSLAEMERQMIIATLQRFDGHRQKTAEALGIGVRTLSGKLRSYGYAPRENFTRAA